jgi:hypothetical protein
MKFVWVWVCESVGACKGQAWARMASERPAPVAWKRIGRGEEAPSSFARSLFVLRASDEADWVNSAFELLDAEGGASCGGHSVVFVGDGAVETDGWRASALEHSDLIMCCESLCAFVLQAAPQAARPTSRMR